MSISEEELVTYFFNKAWIEVEKDFDLEHAVVPLRGSKNNLFESITKSVKMRVHSFTIREILEVCSYGSGPDSNPLTLTLP